VGGPEPLSGGARAGAGGGGGGGGLGGDLPSWRRGLKLRGVGHACDGAPRRERKQTSARGGVTY
jgi:hypothetical protein